MDIDKENIIGKIRTAIDDIAPDVSDSFTDDVDAELWQAVYHAAIALSEELPIQLLDASVEKLTGTVDTARGFAYGKLPENYLRFVSVDIAGTAGILTELIEPGSDMEKMQRSPWSRGTATKPKAMMDHDEKGDKVLVWWPGNDTHGNAQLTYIAVPSLGNGKTVADNEAQETEVADNEAQEAEVLSCAIRNEAERLVVYRAASIFFDGKKESDLADRFRNV
jgi:hypothetical protein